MRLAILVVLSLFGFTAEAEEFIEWVQGNKLYDACERQSGEGFCWGYIAGATAALGLQDKESTFCVGQGVTDTQVRDTVKLWLENHPESRRKLPRAGGA